MGVEPSNKRRAHQHRWIYSSLQVMNIFATITCSGIVEYSLHVVSVVLIIDIYMIIRFASISYVIVLAINISAFIIVSCALKFVLILAVSCRLNSAACCVKGKTSQTNRDILNLKFWKAQRPLSIRVGEHFTLDSKNYVLHVIGRIILENVIELLVTF